MLAIRRACVSARTIYFSNFSPPTRGKIYHYATKPRILARSEVLNLNDPLLYKPVEPISKWCTNASTYDPVISKLMGNLLVDGNRELAREIMRKTFAEIKFIQLAKRRKATGEELLQIDANPISVIKQAIVNCTPILVLHSVRRGGCIYKVPAPPGGEIEARHIAIRWIIESANNKPRNQRIWVSMAHELLAASRNEGSAIAKKKELLKQCEENRAYANYRIF